MKNVSFNEALTYLKDGEVILTANHTSFYLKDNTVTVHTPNSRYKLTLNEFAELFAKQELYLYIPDGSSIDPEKDEAYYSWKSRNAN